jgi:hypothetical protein
VANARTCLANAAVQPCHWGAGQVIIEVVQRRPPQDVDSQNSPICTKPLNKVIFELTLCAATETS